MTYDFWVISLGVENDVASNCRVRLGSSLKRSAVTFAQVIKAAGAFPGIEESTSYGTPALKVRGKLLARLHQGGECFVLRSEFLDREILLQSDPAVFYITDHYRDYPWVLVRLETVAASALPELIERAWRLLAPKTLVKAHDLATSKRGASRS